MHQIWVTARTTATVHDCACDLTCHLLQADALVSTAICSDGEMHLAAHGAAEEGPLPEQEVTLANADQVVNNPIMPASPSLPGTGAVEPDREVNSVVPTPRNETGPTQHWSEPMAELTCSKRTGVTSEGGGEDRQTGPVGTAGLAAETRSNRDTHVSMCDGAESAPEPTAEISPCSTERVALAESSLAPHACPEVASSDARWGESDANEALPASSSPPGSQDSHERQVCDANLMHTDAGISSEGKCQVHRGSNMQHGSCQSLSVHAGEGKCTVERCASAVSRCCNLTLYECNLQCMLLSLTVSTSGRAATGASVAFPEVCTVPMKWQTPLLPPVSQQTIMFLKKSSM